MRQFKFVKLEIKPCGLGYRIGDMEAEWRLRVITDLILSESRTGTVGVGQTEH